MKITKVNTSRLSHVDFDNLNFGKVFSDHMFKCVYKDGRWQDQQILPYGPLYMNPGTQVLHYAQTIFEGMKAYKDARGEILTFRMDENHKRLNNSALRMSIPQISKDIFIDGLIQLLKIDQQWCKYGDGFSLYIRPFIFASSECIKASSSEEFTFIIITSPSTFYYNKDLNLSVENEYSRAANGGVGSIKSGGNYAASFYPTQLANSKGFNQVIWTDSVHHKYIEEAGTMNIWFRIKDKLITPKLTDTILPGITRDSVMVLCHEFGIEFEEKRISIDEILEANDKKELVEIFGTGTAVSIIPISSLTINGKKIQIAKNPNSYAARIKNHLQKIQTGVYEDKYNWTYNIND